jgi:hypothetical protein
MREMQIIDSGAFRREFIAWSIALSWGVGACRRPMNTRILR